MTPGLRQHTLKFPIRAQGIGVHTGETVHLTLIPAPADTGIVFVRTDLPDRPEVRAHVDTVSDTAFSTNLCSGLARVATVEHLMSACSAMGIDNLRIEITGPEVPIMDGSASVFVFLIQAAGVCAQDAPKRFVRIKKKITVQENDKMAVLEPYDGFGVDFSIDFKHPVFEGGGQQKSIVFSQQSFEKEIGRARTFGFLSDYEMLRANQLARGADMENTIILDDERVINRKGLRYSDEFVRHKILDAVGDLYLLGSSVIGFFTGFKSGHSMNNQLLRTLLSDKTAFEWVTFEDQ